MLVLVVVAGAAWGIALVPAASGVVAGGLVLAPVALVVAVSGDGTLPNAVGLVPGVRAGAARVQAPKCRRQSSSVMSGALGTAAGGT